MQSKTGLCVYNTHNGYAIQQKPNLQQHFRIVAILHLFIYPLNDVAVEQC